MARRQRLVLQHLENVDGKLLVEYSQLIGDMIQGQAGVYALYRGERLYYVGLAVDLKRRLNNHRGDRHKRKWNRFSVYLMKPGEHIKELESLLLRIASPRGNRSSGRLGQSVDLRADLRSRIKTHHDEKLAKMMGRSVARRGKPRGSNKKKAARRAGAKPLPLAGVVPRQRQLRGYYKGYYYFARLRANGTVHYNGEVFNSATGAARAVTGTRLNGKMFWHIRDASREWVRLKHYIEQA